MLDRLSIRWRLALISSLLTFMIIGAFAVVIGETTTRRIRDDFQGQVVSATDALSNQLQIKLEPYGFTQRIARVDPPLDAFAAPEHAQIRLLSLSGQMLTQTRNAQDFDLSPGTSNDGDYLVSTRSLPLNNGNIVYIQYARPLSQQEATIRRLRFFLFFGTIAGTLLALGGGLILAQRAMRPVKALTRTAREIATTRDPNRRVPVPAADDEVAELAYTLHDMLQGLESSRAETSAALSRQRQFVADASHELRTPLTSVYANLELLAETLPQGDQQDAAGSALRSTQRMKRLVGDLLLLARADAERKVASAPTDLSQIVVDAAGELGPVATAHELHVDQDDGAVLVGARDDLFRMALNLMQNAIEHTPAGTRVEAAVRVVGEDIVLTVSDDGPGIDPEVRDRIFERFVRGAGDRGGSTGLGLAIVKAVAEAHGGTVTVEDATENLINRGTRFTVRLPRTATAPSPEAQAGASV